MPELTNPEGVHPPLGGYHHCALVPARARWLALAGQVGMNADGALADGFRAQAEAAFRNVLTCLQAGGFRAADLVRLTIYITDRANLQDMRDARVAVLGADVKPPSTLLVISGLADPAMLIEVEALAAQG